MTCSIDNSNSFNPQLISRSNLAHVTCIMHHVVCVTLHRFTKIADGFKQKSVRFTPNTPLNYTISYLAHRNSTLHHLFVSILATMFAFLLMQPSSHFQFVQHELTSNNHQQYLPVLYIGLLTATNQLSTGIK